MPRRRLQNFLSNSTVPLKLTPPSQSETHNDDEEQGVQEGPVKENTYEDKQTNRVLQKQNIESHIFHLPINYKVDAILGHGAHGVVAAATIASADKRIAIKQIKLNLEPRNDEGNLYQWKSVCRELSLLRRLSENGGHPNVIMLQDVVFVSTSNQHEIMFLINLMKTSLDTLIKSGSLTSEEKQRYIFQILCGLHYLHANSIIHRDLKPANVLVNGDKLCIADLGQARVNEIVRDTISLSICGDTSTIQIMTNYGVGTFNYRPPELHVKCSRYSYPVDLWSVGCILGEMFLKANKTLFTAGEQDNNPFAIIEQIFQLIGTPTSPDDIEWLPDTWAKTIRSRCSRGPLEPKWDELSITDDTVLDLLKKLLEFNPSRRITAREALQHIYFSNLDLPNLEVVSHSSSSSVNSTATLYQVTTTQEVRDIIYNEIKLMKQND